MKLKLSQSWWETDSYDDEGAIPQAILDATGPRGVALVRVRPGGQTSPGWGLQGKNGAEGFMPRYMRGEFAPRSVLYGYERDKWAFAFVMRSINMIVVDIDGKNGGLEHANELLGNAAPTLAEVSKSGNGYHLFYSTDETWDDLTGFGEMSDAIGIVQGVDIRATGCVYHHKQQRWNDREVAPLPQHIRDRLVQRAQRKAAASAAAASVATLDPLERLMAHEELIAELNAPIPSGKRNNTLFAIGSRLKEAGVENWEKLVEDRADALGLDIPETSRLVRNIGAYSA